MSRVREIAWSIEASIYFTIYIYFHLPLKLRKFYDIRASFTNIPNNAILFLINSQGINNPSSSISTQIRFVYQHIEDDVFTNQCDVSQTKVSVWKRESSGRKEVCTYRKISGETGPRSNQSKYFVERVQNKLRIDPLFSRNAGR